MTATPPMRISRTAARAKRADRRARSKHGTRGPAVGAIYDGTGYGTDGTVWGGELLVGGLEGFDRAGHLWPVRLPGGARAVREPWRTRIIGVS